ncbi:MAG: PqqD family protein [Spartobacteria bacterium]|nr:PqqD family protein [Spartobacteria bacterium]
MSRVFEKSEKVVERCIREEYILVPVMSSEENLNSLYTLNETAGLIWREACAGGSEQDLVEQVIARFEVDRETAREDVHHILNDLVRIGALREVFHPA